MRTLSSPISTQIAARQSGWCEVYDFYLKAAISTPYGTTNLIRITDCPGGRAFFAPTTSPEPTGSQGSAQTYAFWPLKRKVAKGTTRFANDTMNITASNVTGDWADMLADVDWYDVPVVCRKVSLTIAVPTSGDAAIVFSGRVQSAKVTSAQIQFTCSNDFATFATALPSESMHCACRFAWGDDLCTALKYAAANYKSKTCGSGSTTTTVVSSGFTEDTGSSSSYGPDLVASLATSAITASSYMTGHEPYKVQSGNGPHANWQFSDGVSNPSSPGYDVYKPWIQFDLGTAQAPTYLYIDWGNNCHWGRLDGPNMALEIYGSDDAVTFTLVASPLCVRAANFNPSFADSVGFFNFSGSTASHRYWRLVCSFVNGQPFTGLVMTSANMQTPTSADLINPLADTAITAVSAGTGHEAHRVKSSEGPDWSIASAPAASAYNTSDWGNNYQGYWQIPDAQAGLKNPALTPWIQFDFGSNKNIKLWQIQTLPLGDPLLTNPAPPAGADPVLITADTIPRVIEFFSSVNGTDWTFESYFEIPAAPGETWDVLIPNAVTARYWRVCVRSIWQAAIIWDMFSTMKAYEGSRHWWKSGMVTFGPSTATAALRNVSRNVLASYSGQCAIVGLPVAPAAGDVFTIQRGCPRSFNACAEKQNTENFGGWTTLPDQTVVYD